MDDWYQVLQVSWHASGEEIKASYRKLSKRYHPDANPGDKECERRFQEITEAYSILSDSEKRRKYDERFGRVQQKKRFGDRNRRYHMPEATSADLQNIHKNFEHFFGFNPETKDIVNEEKLKTKAGNPMDTTEMFEKFMGIKR